MKNVFLLIFTCLHLSMFCQNTHKIVCGYFLYDSLSSLRYPKNPFQYDIITFRPNVKADTSKKIKRDSLSVFSPCYAIQWHNMYLEVNHDQIVLRELYCCYFDYRLYWLADINKYQFNAINNFLSKMKDEFQTDSMEICIRVDSIVSEETDTSLHGHRYEKMFKKDLYKELVIVLKMINSNITIGEQKILLPKKSIFLKIKPVKIIDYPLLHYYFLNKDWVF